MGADIAEGLVDFFEAADEVEDMSAGIGTAGGGAKVCAAAEGARFVDEAAGGFRVEEGAGAVGAGGKGSAARGTEGVGGDEGFAACEEWCFAGELEMATVGAESAGAFEGTGVKVNVNFFDFACGAGFRGG